MIRERFAPSPTGLLHLGHAYSALMAWDAAYANNGTFLLRIEDTDQARCKDEYVSEIFDNLRWLELEWPEPVLYQTARMPAYYAALEKLIAFDLCYPCRCTRKDITQALSAPQEGETQTFGPDGPIYPGVCRKRSMRDYSDNEAIRLDMSKAVAFIDTPLTYTEIGGEKPESVNITAEKLLTETGDIVLARKDIGTSYHLSVVVDDAYQNITHVTRGRDLIPATPIHRLLQAILDLPTPIYRHHRLIRDKSGKRLAKRFDAMAISKYRTDGFSAQDIRHMVGL